MKPKAILFDLDCTLIDRRKALHGYAKRLIDDYRDRLDVHDTDDIAAFVIQADGGGYREQERYSDIVTGLAWNDPPTMDEIEEHWWEFTPLTAVHMDHAVEVLESIRDKGIKLGMVTNGSIRMQSSKIETLGIRDYFDSIVISEQVGVHKPDPATFNRALGELDVDAQDAWFVGDHPEKDIMGAHRLGMTAFWMEGWQEWPEGLDVPHHPIKDLRQILKMIEH